MYSIAKRPKCVLGSSSSRPLRYVVVLLSPMVFLGLCFAQFDLSISIQNDVDNEAIAGEEYRYSIAVHNAGPAGALAVSVTVTLPLDVTYQADSLNLGTVNPGAGPSGEDEVDFALGALGNGDSLQFDIRVHVSPSAVANEGGPFAAIASATVFPVVAPESDPSDNTDTDAVFIDESADLRITTLAPSGIVPAGQTFEYWIFVDNLGPSSARNVIIRDDILLSGSYSSQSFSVSPTTGAVILTFDPDLGEGEALLEGILSELLPASSTETGRFWVAITLLANESRSVSSLSTVRSDTPDPNPANNDAATSASIEAVVDLEVEKIATGETLVAGQPEFDFDITTPGTAFPEAPNYETSASAVNAGRRIQYELVVRNNGPSTATNVVVRDFLPPGVLIYPGSVVLSQGAFVGGVPGDPLSPMICNLGTMNSSNLATIQFEVVVSPSLGSGDVLENAVFVSTDEFDPDNSNNLASTQTLVNVCRPDAPQNVQATDGTRLKSVLVTWDLVTDVTNYTVYRSQINNFSTASLVATVDTPHFVDFPPELDTPRGIRCDNRSHLVWYYWVVSNGLCGESLPSSSDSGYIQRTYPKTSAAEMFPVDGLSDLGVIALVLLAGWLPMRRRSNVTA